MPRNKKTSDAEGESPELPSEYGDDVLTADQRDNLVKLSDATGIPLASLLALLTPNQRAHWHALGRASVVAPDDTSDEN